VAAQPNEVLELDEMWSFVRFRKNKRWVWLAQCRRTRQIVAYAIGDRSETTCRLLWERVPPAYKRGLLYTDFWSASALVCLCFGLPLLKYCPKDSIGPRAKGRDKPATSSASTAFCASDWRGLCGAHFHSPSAR